MFRKLLWKLGEQTSLAILLRKIVELNFRKQKSAIRNSLPLSPGERVLSEIQRVLKPKGKALIMEDTRSERLFTRLMHSLDQGAYIRTKQEWGALFGNFFTIRRTWTFTSGICFYSAFLLMNKI